MHGEGVTEVGHGSPSNWECKRTERKPELLGPQSSTETETNYLDTKRRKGQPREEPRPSTGSGQQEGRAPPIRYETFNTWSGCYKPLGHLGKTDVPPFNKSFPLNLLSLPYRTSDRHLVEQTPLH